MENPTRPFTGIIADSPEIIRATKEYQQKVENIKAEINLKYVHAIKHERNYIKKLFLLIKKRFEIKRAIRQLTSLDKLYLTAQ